MGRFFKKIPKDVSLVNPIWISEFGATYPYKNETPRKMGYKKLQSYKGTLGVSLKNKSYKNIFDELLPPYATYSRSRKETKIDSYEFPVWKKNFIKKNREFYKTNKYWIDPWLKKYKKANISMLNEPTHRKFEWNCHGEKIYF